MLLLKLLVELVKIRTNEASLPGVFIHFNRPPPTVHQDQGSAIIILSQTRAKYKQLHAFFPTGREEKRRRIIYKKGKNIKEAQSPKNVEFISWVSFFCTRWPVLKRSAMWSHLFKLSVKVIVVVLVEDVPSAAACRTLAWSTSSLITGRESKRRQKRRLLIN